MASSESQHPPLRQKKVFELPLFPTTLKQIVYPGSFQPLNIFEPAAEALINHCLTQLPPHRRFFGLLFRTADHPDNNVGSLVKLCNAYYPEEAEGEASEGGSGERKQKKRFIVLTKCLGRFKVLSPSSSSTATTSTSTTTLQGKEEGAADHGQFVLRPADEVEEEEEEIKYYRNNNRHRHHHHNSDSDATLFSIIRAVDYNDLSEGEEEENEEAEGEEETDDKRPYSPTEKAELLRSAARMVQNFCARFHRNSVWKVVRQRIGEEPPVHSPKALSFWMAASLPGVVSEEKMLSLLHSRNTYARLALAMELFRSNPPVRALLTSSTSGTSSGAASSSSGSSSSSALLRNVGEGEEEEEGRRIGASVASLKDHCVEFVCSKWLSDTNVPVRFTLPESIHQLPVEVIERVLLHLHRTQRLQLDHLTFFSKFSVENLYLSNVNAVNDDWLANAVSFYSSLTLLDLSRCYSISSTAVAQCLNRMPRLRALYLSRCKRIDDKALEDIGKKCPDLQILYLDGTRVGNATLMHLRSLPFLVEISISGTQIANSGIEVLLQSASSKPSLLSSNAEEEEEDGPPPLVDATSSAFEEYRKTILSAVRPIRVLKASRLHLRDEGAAAIGRLSLSLNALDVCFNPMVQDWSFLSSLYNLTFLDLSLNASFTDEFMEPMGELTSLIHLNLSNTDITNAGIPHLFNLPELVFLDLSKTLVSTKPLGPGLKHWPHLRHLALAYTHVSNKLVPYLAALQNLVSFKATGCVKFSDEGLCALAQLRLDRLEVLEIGCPAMTDAALSHLGELSSLRVLNLWNTSVTTKGSDLIQELTDLVPNDMMNTNNGTYLFIRS
ncbi:hypothetical protein QOT17_004586 [Balamuthia mandrillaris]